jgi:hypothetical protein
METYWIIGGGKFGRKAAKAIRDQKAASQIVILEKESRICKQLENQGFETICTDGIRYLAHNLANGDFPDWIIPAIPLHVAFEWMQSKLSNKYKIETFPISDQLENQLPNPIRGSSGQLYVSNADFICPDDCPEPEEICTYTGEPRPRMLNSFLQKIQYNDFRAVVVCSQQLFPGVGGYTPKALFQVLKEIENKPGPVLLSTACLCHGVLHAFRMSPRP